MKQQNYLYLLAYLLIGFLSLNVFFVSYVQALGFDDSFNLQIAKSLANDFIYQSTYYPRYIYDYRITTNGFIQYLAALDFRLFGDRLGLAITLALIAAFSLTAYLKYSWKTFIASVILIISYPTFSSLMTSFLGEICALGFLILGCHFTQRQLKDSEASSGIFSYTVGSTILYGLAISTKLIAAIVLPFILFGFFYKSNRFEKNLFFSAIRNSLTTYLLSVIVFVAIFYISVLHSKVFLIAFGHSVSDFFVSDPGLIKFIQHHFWQQSVGVADMFKLNSYSATWLIPMLFASLVLLIYTSRGWIPFAIITIILLAKGGLHERRLFLFIIPAILLAADSIFCNDGAILKSTKKYTDTFKILASFIILSVWIYVLVTGLSSSSSFSLLKPKFNWVKDYISASDLNNNKFVISKSGIKVSKAIKEGNLPIMTSGWWQFPELQLFSKTSFYDRMDLSVANYLKDVQPLLLFNPTNESWPETSIKMCSKIIIETPEYVLCNYDMTLPLNYRWGIK